MCNESEPLQNKPIPRPSLCRPKSRREHPGIFFPRGPPFSIIRRQNRYIFSVHVLIFLIFGSVVVSLACCACLGDFNIPNMCRVHNCYYWVIIRKTLSNLFIFYGNQHPKTGSTRCSACHRAGQPKIPISSGWGWGGGVDYRVFKYVEKRRSQCRLLWPRGQ